MTTQKSFIKNFWQEKKMVGAMSPSSKFLAQKMLKNVDFKKAKVIIELGPGTGVFTKKILEKMAPDAKLLVFELNTDFYNMLKAEIQDNRMVLIHDSAEKITEYLHQENLLNADYVISSLPLANFPKKLVDTILQHSEKCRKIHPVPVFAAFQKIARKPVSGGAHQFYGDQLPAGFCVYLCEREVIIRIIG